MSRSIITQCVLSKATAPTALIYQFAQEKSKLCIEVRCLFWIISLSPAYILVRNFTFDSYSLIILRFSRVWEWTLTVAMMMVARHWYWQQWMAMSRAWACYWSWVPLQSRKTSKSSKRQLYTILSIVHRKIFVLIIHMKSYWWLCY